MGSEMVERVAKAVKDAMSDVCSIGYKPDALRVARAAIAAMREPTEAMVRVCYKADADEMVDLYRVMIDAALGK